MVYVLRAAYERHLLCNIGRIKIRKTILFLAFLIFIMGYVKEEKTPLQDTTVTAEVIKNEKSETEEEIIENVTTVRLCHDTDNGIVRWANGVVFGFYSKQQQDLNLMTTARITTI